MEYRFQRTINGPVLVSEDEVLYFHQHGQLQDYIDSDPEFFPKGYDFCSDALREYGEMLADAIVKPVAGVEHAVNLMAYWAAAEQLRHLEQSMHQGFPGPNNPSLPQIP